MATRKDRLSGYFSKFETLTATEQRKIHNRKLRHIIAYAYEKAPAIKKKLDRAKVKPGDLVSVKDLERLPITEKADLVGLQKKNPPFGGLNGVTPDALGRIFISPGPIYEPGERFYEDNRWAQGLFAGGFRAGDLCQITFNFHLVPFGFMLDSSLKLLDCRTIPAGVGSTELQVRIMKDLKVTGFLGTPSFLFSALQKAKEMGFNPKKDLALKTAFVAAEMLTESLRDTLESELGLMVRQSYGTADIGCLGFECIQKNGMHFPDDCIVEIVDPRTGRQCGPGEIGEVVGTCFNKVYPLIRFGSGDLSYLSDEPCLCGRTSPRLMKIVGRVDQMTKVKGMFIHPGLVDTVAAKFNEICACQVVVTREGHQDKMTFRAELSQSCPDPKKWSEALKKVIQEILRVRGEVQILPKGSLPKEAKKIEDQRVWE
ncbi:MAG: AMP-binding protein [Deltaproteobacteria bacterium]|nr:AMP-binding protein [Deltaproteobacteria bacterium]